MALRFIMFLFYASLHCQNDPSEDKLFWSDSIKLTWSDFKGGVPFGDIGFKKAAIATEVVAKCIDYTDDCVPIFVVKTFCVRNESWVFEKSDIILRHEQGHFDIAEIIARRIRKNFYDLNKMKECDMEKYSQTFSTFLEELDLTHKLYDKEVTFSEEYTLEWYKKIDEELNELKDYKFVD